MAGKTRKQRIWNQWSKLVPGTHERTQMYKRCGKGCFLGTRKSFPICSRGTCKQNRYGILAAYIRAKEYAEIPNKSHRSDYYARISGKANRMLRRSRRLYRGKS
jgi:hypothetical protein